MTTPIVVEKEPIDETVRALEQRVAEVKNTLATPAVASDPRFREQATRLAQSASEVGDGILAKAHQAQEYARKITENDESSAKKLDAAGESKRAAKGGVSADLTALLQGVGSFLEKFLDEKTFGEFAKGIKGLFDALEPILGKDLLSGARGMWDAFESNVPTYRENMEQLRKAGEQFREVTGSLEKTLKSSGLDKAFAQISQSLGTSSATSSTSTGTPASTPPSTPSPTSTSTSSSTPLSPTSQSPSSTSTSTSTGTSTGTQSSTSASTSTDASAGTTSSPTSASTSTSTSSSTPLSPTSHSPASTPASTPTYTPTSTPTYTPTSTPTYTPTSTPTYTSAGTSSPTPVMFDSPSSSSSGSGGGYTIARDDLKEIIRNAILLSEQGGSETQLTGAGTAPASGMLSTEGYGQIGTVVGTPVAQGTLDTSQVTFEKPASTPLNKDQMLAVIGQALDIHGIQDPAARSKWAGTLMYIAQNESSFNPAAGNGWDSNARGAMKSDGFPAQSSRGLFQFIPASFASSHMAGTSTSIYDPLAGAAACVKYLQTRYGIRPDGAGLDEFYSARYPVYHGY